MCFYDLQKAFDSVEYPVLLRRLYDAGINGRTWRLLKAWYNHPKCKVNVDGQLSAEFTLERGMLQGSVLSPVLFLLVMDPLLRELEQSKLVPPSRTSTLVHTPMLTTYKLSQAAFPHYANKYKWFRTLRRRMLWC